MTEMICGLIVFRFISNLLRFSPSNLLKLLYFSKVYGHIPQLVNSICSLKLLDNRQLNKYKFKIFLISLIKP